MHSPLTWWPKWTDFNELNGEEETHLGVNWSLRQDFTWNPTQIRIIFSISITIRIKTVVTYYINILQCVPVTRCFENINVRTLIHDHVPVSVNTTVRSLRLKICVSNYCWKLNSAQNFNFIELNIHPHNGPSAFFWQYKTLYAVTVSAFHNARWHIIRDKQIILLSRALVHTLAAVQVNKFPTSYRETATGHYPKPLKFSPHPHTLFKIRFNIILPSM